MAKTKINKSESECVVTYTKGQILNSEKYKNRRDALGVILKDDGVYTVEEVDSLLEKFMKGKVN